MSMKMKVLVIDDDQAITTLIETYLFREGFEVITRDSGATGIEAVREWQPDVILMDLMMPKLDGWQACRAIRTFSQVPIVILSAVTDAERVMRALEAGANDFMVKPPQFKLLAARLVKLVEAHQAE